MKRLSLLIGLAFALSSGFAAAKPNVVFIDADDLGWGDIACHGHPRVRTPNIDRLAREGTDFWSFTVANPVCSPSRTGLVTGQFSSRRGVHHRRRRQADAIRVRRAGTQKGTIEPLRYPPDGNGRKP